MSFSEMSRPFDEEPVAATAATSKRNTNTSFGSHNSQSATIVMANSAPTTPRSWADPSKPPRGREQQSVERQQQRGREQSVERTTTTREAPLIEAPSPKRGDNSASDWQKTKDSQNLTTKTATTEEQPAATALESSFHKNASWSSGKEADKKIMQVKNYIATQTTTNDSTNSLVDKLKAIRRDNPADALAQIDAILRQESRSMSGDPDASPPQRRNSTDTRDKEATLVITNDDQEHQPEEQEEEEEEETDSDDETSVSSMTNPTYQSVRQEQAQAQIRDQNPFGDTNPFSNTFGQQQQQPPALATHPFATTNPSTASFRKPRPSALGGYKASPSQEISTALPQQESRSKEKKRMLKEFPPPITIKIKDTPPKRAPSPIHDSSTNPFEQETPKTKSPAPAKKLDKFMATSSAELAAKIRVWDEMSSGLQKSVSGDSAKHKEEKKTDDRLPYRAHLLPTPPPVSSRRSHPWDNSISVPHERVDTRETSMVEGMGIEMAVPSRTSNPFENFEESFGNDNTPVKSSSQQQVVNSDPFEAFDSEPNLFSSDAGVVNEWDTTTQRFTPQRQENTQKISDAFDQAWVSLPPSSFSAAAPFSEQPRTQPGTFQERPRTSPVKANPPRRRSSSVEASQTTVPTSPRLLQLPKRSPQDLHESTDFGGIEVSLLDDDDYQQETQTTDGKEKRRGFFRAFKRKDPKSKSCTSMAGSASGDGTQSSHTPPPPPKQREQPPASPRSRRGSRTPTTQGAGNNSPSRSKSVDRFRSASMAHKFGRVNRVYDRD